MKKIRWVACMNPNCREEVRENTLYCKKCKVDRIEEKRDYRTINKARVLFSEVDNLSDKELNKTINYMQSA